MLTRLTYENYSLNTNVRRVSLTWLPLDIGGLVQPLVWREIIGCGYGWQHSIAIKWETRCEVQDSYGNMHQLTFGAFDPQTGVTVNLDNQGTQDEMLDIKLAAPRSDLKLRILRSGLAMLEISLASLSNLSLSLPSKLLWRADASERSGEPVKEQSGTVFDLYGLAQQRVCLRGGEPTSTGTALTFCAYQMVGF